ncbi:MAG TPA: glycosyltransferase family 2 protein [Gammaproteobacteria bacterium]|nr:glycosyltransferase family 2 protein [Gammaproteobacteria bacterium]
MNTHLSAIIITYNAASQLVDCLNSLSFVSEILILDSGSDDETRNIAQQYNARFIHQDWLGYGPQKQKAVELAEHDWVLCLDADECISEELAVSIQSVMESPQYQAYQFPRCNRFMGRWLRHGEGYPDISLRLFNRQHARWSNDAVHEFVQTDVSTGTLKGDLLHDSAASLASYLEKQNQYTSLQAEKMYQAGKTAGVGKMLLNPLFRFFKFYLFRLGFLDGVPGLVHICIGCQNTFIKYAKLITLQRT